MLSISHAIEKVLPFNREQGATGGAGLQPTDPSKRKRRAVAVPEQHFPPSQSPPGYVSIAHGECVSLMAPGKRRPHLSFKRGASRAPQVLRSAMPEGLKA